MEATLVAIAVAFALLIAGVFFSTYRSSYQVLTVLVGASGGLVAVQAANVHVFTVLVTAWWFLSPRREGRDLSPLLIPLAALPIATTALTGDLVNNPALALQLVAFSLNGAMIASRVTTASRDHMLRGLLVACSAASIMGLGQVIGIVPNETWHVAVSSLGRPTAFFPEPDWLGLFSVVGLLLSWRTLAPRSRLRYALIGLNGAVAVLAFARAAWVALAVAVLIYALAGIVSRRREDRRGGTIPALVLVAVLGVVALSALPSLRADLATRVSTLTGAQQTDVSGQARIQQTDGLLRLAATAPWNGHGLSASGRVGVSGIYNSESANSVGSNWVLSLWVDARILAIPMLLLIGLVALYTARSVPGQLLLVLCFNNLFSNATFQPVTWVALGLALATAGPLSRGSATRVEGDGVDRDGGSPRQLPPRRSGAAFARSEVCS